MTHFIICKITLKVWGNKKLRIIGRSGCIWTVAIFVKIFISHKNQNKPFWLSSTDAVVLLRAPPLSMLIPPSIWISDRKKYLGNIFHFHKSTSKNELKDSQTKNNSFNLQEQKSFLCIILLWALHWENHFLHRKWQVCEVSYNGWLRYKFSCFVAAWGQ